MRNGNIKAGPHRLTAGLALAAALVLALALASVASANGVALVKGDVLAATGSAQVKNFSPTGVLQDTLTDNTGAEFTTGMCFDSKANLYVTDFETTMSKYDSGGNLLVSPFGEGFASGHPESCTIDAKDHIYVGGPFGASIEELNTSGTLLETFAVEGAGGTGGTDWIDIAADQCTIFYASEGGEIKRYNVCTHEQLSNFASGLPAPCFALRIRPNKEVLVACASEVLRLNTSGEVVQTYTFPGQSFLFAMNLDPDNETFWTGDINNGQIWRANIATGKVVTEFNSAPSTSLAGLAVVGEIEIAHPTIILSPTTAENEVGTTHTVTATVTEEGAPAAGVEVTFTVTGANPQTGKATTNANGEASFTYKGETAGTDHIVASFVDKESETKTSNEVTKIWTEPVVKACTHAEGTVRVTINHERQTAGNNVSTNLKAKPQRFVFTWENGAEKAKLVKLTSASCEEIAPGRDKFVGEGTASLNGEPGYRIRFAISTLGNGGNEVAMQLFKGTERVASFKITAISKEVFS
jgi:Bacterial Ig-like domain (group 1)